MRSFNVMFGLFAMFSVAMVACTTQPPKPETPRQVIAYAYASVETAVDAVAAAKTNGVIDRSEVESYKEILREAVSHLVAAEQLVAQYDAVMPPDVQSDVQFRLSQALAITSLINQMLCEASNECSSN